MKNNKKINPIIQKILIQYFLTTLILLLILGGTPLLLRRILLQRVWQEKDFFYPFLSFVGNNLVAIVIVGVFIIWIINSTYFMTKMTGYLNEVIQGTSQLLDEPDKRLYLSKDLFNVQEEMNLLREQNNHNQRAAKEAEQRKNDLIVYLAHDLRTPLTSVIGYLTLLQEEPDLSPTARARYTGIALDKAQRLEQLIGEFFEITRFNLTTLVLNKEVVDLSLMLEQISYEFLPILAEKHLSWHLAIEKNCQVTIDAEKMERVFDNLIRNAINYSYSDTTLILSLSVDEQIQISLSNQGPTIPPEKIERIFEPFYRMDTARGTSSGGTGLGLPIAKEIIGAFDGTLTATSENNTVTFTICLPKDT